MSFHDAIKYINSTAQYGSRLGLERVARLCGLAGNPQDAVRTVHVAGTNGKGSTSAMLSCIFSAAGYKTGLYTSPYVEDVRECMMIGGKAITEEEFATVADEIKEFSLRMEREGEPPTEFEVETAMAFLWFQKSGCDIAVIETGLGGRLDATNVIRSPLVSVVTSISLDHTAILGGTVDKIAFEKCGIFKPGGLAVSYPFQPAAARAVIQERAAGEGNPLFIPEPGDVEVLSAGLDGTDITFKGLELHIPLVGAHQVWNAATAVQAVLALREHKGLAIPDGCIAEGIRRTVMPLRQQVVSRKPIIMLDGAHNPDGLAALAGTMKRHLSGRRVAVVMGMLADKDYSASVALVAPLCGRFTAVTPKSARALPAGALAQIAGKYCKDVTVAAEYLEAMAGAVQYAGEEGAVVVCGSLYIAEPMSRVYYSNERYLADLIR